MIVSCHVGGAVCKEVHLSLETHSEVDGGVCIGDETINILLLYKLTFSTKELGFDKNRHKRIMLEQKTLVSCYHFKFPNYIVAPNLPKLVVT